MYSIVYLLFGTVNMTIENREDIIILHSIRTLVFGNNHASLRVQSTRHGFASLMATIEDSTLLHISMSQRSYILEIDPSRKVREQKYIPREIGIWRPRIGYFRQHQPLYILLVNGSFTRLRPMSADLVNRKRTLLTKENLISDSLVVNGFQNAEFSRYRIGLITLPSQKQLKIGQQFGRNILKPQSGRMKLDKRCTRSHVLDGGIDLSRFPHNPNLPFEIAIHQLRRTLYRIVEQGIEIDLHIQRLQPLNLLLIMHQRTIDLTLQRCAFGTIRCQSFRRMIPITGGDGETQRDKF